MPPAGSASSSSELSASRELVRSAARWFIAGLGAIGVVLVAGSQLSSVGALSLDDGRFWAAIAGVVLGLLSILWAMWRVVDVLAPTNWAFEDVVAAWGDAPAAPQRSHWWNRSQRRSVGRFLRDHPLMLGGFESPAEIQAEYERSSPGREGLDALVDLMDDVLDKAATLDLQDRFTTLRGQIAAGVMVGAAGIILFAWAANPPPPDTRPIAVMQGVDLSGVDLRGVTLRHADLREANLTRADLTDADLTDADLDGVTWSHTTCPDGTNSDSGTRNLASGERLAGSCAEHRRLR